MWRASWWFLASSHLGYDRSLMTDVHRHLKFSALSIWINRKAFFSWSIKEEASNSDLEEIRKTSLSWLHFNWWGASWVNNQVEKNNIYSNSPQKHHGWQVSKDPEIRKQLSVAKFGVWAQCLFCIPLLTTILSFPCLLIL